jgi:MFS family permease
MSIIAATIHPDDRGRAFGAWAGLSGVASSVGPFLGGWLIDAVSWRLIFLINLPLAAAGIAIAMRHVPETRAPLPSPPDLTGALLVTVALAGISYATIEHNGATSTAAALVGLAALVAFVLVERSSPHPMLPLVIFRSPQFTGINLATLAVYAGVGAAFFLVVLRLQVSIGYSALEAGAALVPFTLLMLFLSPAAGQLGQKIGARLPMTLGPILVGTGMLLLSRIAPGDRYATAVLPAVVVFGLGMSLTVAPLTAAVLASVGDALTGVASGVSNAVARLAGLLAVAAIPALAGISAKDSLAIGLERGYADALVICAGLCALGSVASWVFVRTSVHARPSLHPSPFQPCLDRDALVGASDNEGGSGHERDL